MHINKIQIENFRCLDEISVKPKKINLLVGRNNTGKSSFLYSILVGGGKIKNINDKILRNLIKYGNDKAKIEIKTETKNIITEIYNSNCEEFNDEFEKFEKELYKCLKNIKQIIQDNLIKRYKNKLVLIKYKSKDLDESIFIGLKSLERNIFKKLKSSNELIKFSNLIEKYSEPIEILNICSYLESINYFGELKVVPILSDWIDESIEELKSISIPSLLNTTKILHEIEILDKKYIITKENGNIILIDTEKLKSYPFEIQGSGFRRLILLLSIIFSEKNKIVILEEPENHLHPGYINKFVKVIIDNYQKYNLQLFISTHNRDIIEAFIDYLRVKEDCQDDFNILQFSKVPLEDKEKIVCRQLDYKKAQEMIEELYLDLREP